MVKSSCTLGVNGLAIEKLLLSVGFPKPLREYRFAATRRWRFDYAWPDEKIALEIEGGIWIGGRHVRGPGYENDCRKYNAAALHGWRVFRATPQMLSNGELLSELSFLFAEENRNDD